MISGIFGVLSSINKNKRKKNHKSLVNYAAGANVSRVFYRNDDFLHREVHLLQPAIVSRYIR